MMVQGPPRQSSPSPAGENIDCYCIQIFRTPFPTRQSRGLLFFHECLTNQYPHVFSFLAHTLYSIYFDGDLRLALAFSDFVAERLHLKSK